MNLVKLLVWDCCYFHVLLVVLCNSFPACALFVCCALLACLLATSLSLSLEYALPFPSLPPLKPLLHSSCVFPPPHMCHWPQTRRREEEEKKQKKKKIVLEGEEEESRSGRKNRRLWRTRRKRRWWREEEEKEEKKREGGEEEEEEEQQQQQQKEKVVKNKNVENHISDTHCYLRVCKSLAAALVLWVLTLVSWRLLLQGCLLLYVYVCFFVGGASGGGFVVDSEIEMREV